MIIKIGIATAGRRAALTDTLRQLSHQTRKPEGVIICPATPEDCDESILGTLPYACQVVRGKRGSAAQRNAILAACSPCDVLVFFDDDYYPSESYLDNLEQLFVAQPDIVGVTGYVVVDGAISHGVSHAEALELLTNHRTPGPAEANQLDAYSLYGCNMAFSLAPIVEHDLRFDERLPLYGWLEDVDFSRQLARYGRLIQSWSLTGVHLAVKSGRTSGLRIGYSQIANPWYLLRKGTLAPKRAWRQVSRNVAANAYRCLKPEPWVDRRGRLQGNALAALHFLVGRLDPEKVLDLPG